MAEWFGPVGTTRREVGGGHLQQDLPSTGHLYCQSLRYIDCLQSSPAAAFERETHHGNFCTKGGLQYRGPHQIVRALVDLQSALHHRWAFALEMIHSKGRLHIIKMRFHLPAPQIKRATFLSSDGFSQNVVARIPPGVLCPLASNLRRTMRTLSARDRHPEAPLRLWPVLVRSDTQSRTPP